MTEYWLADAGVTLRNQINRRWPNRDTASDGWIGDASHAAGVSDHNPCWTCKGDRYGVVRAIDVDADLGAAGAMDTLTGQLRRCARDKQDNGRVAYIIWDGAICSPTSGWRWRPYSGTNPHNHHAHVSFTERGDHRGAPFPLPVFTAKKRRRLTRVIGRLSDRIDKARRLRAKARRERARLPG